MILASREYDVKRTQRLTLDKLNHSNEDVTKRDREQYIHSATNQFRMFRILIADEHRLGGHDFFHNFQPRSMHGGTSLNKVDDAVGKPKAACCLHRPGYEPKTTL